MEISVLFSKKSAYFGPIFEKSVNFEHFVNGKWSHYKSNFLPLEFPHRSFSALPCTDMIPAPLNGKAMFILEF